MRNNLFIVTSLFDFAPECFILLKNVTNDFKVELEIS